MKCKLARRHYIRRRCWRWRLQEEDEAVAARSRTIRVSLSLVDDGFWSCAFACLPSLPAFLWTRATEHVVMCARAGMVKVSLRSYRFTLAHQHTFDGRARYLYVCRCLPACLLVVVIIVGGSSGFIVMPKSWKQTTRAVVVIQAIHVRSASLSNFASYWYAGQSEFQ